MTSRYTRSRLKAKVLYSVYLRPLNQNTCKNRSRFTGTRDREGHVQGHVTLTYKVTLKGYRIDVCLFEIQHSKFFYIDSNLGLDSLTLSYS